MTYTYETALIAARARGYAGEYAEIVAADMAGRTPDEIAETSAEFNRTYLRRAAYARAAERETDPRRAAHYLAVSLGGR